MGHPPVGRTLSCSRLRTSRCRTSTPWSSHCPSSGSACPGTSRMWRPRRRGRGTAPHSSRGTAQRYRCRCPSRSGGRRAADTRLQTRPRSTCKTPYFDRTCLDCYTLLMCARRSCSRCFSPPKLVQMDMFLQVQVTPVSAAEEGDAGCASATLLSSRQGTTVVHGSSSCVGV